MSSDYMKTDAAVLFGCLCDEPFSVNETAIVCREEAELGHISVEELKVLLDDPVAVRVSIISNFCYITVT